MNVAGRHRIACCGHEEQFVLRGIAVKICFLSTFGFSQAHSHLAIDSAVAASAGSPVAAQAPVSFRIYRSRAFFLVPVLEQSALPGFSTPGRWPLYIRIIRDLDRTNTYRKYEASEAVNCA